MKAVAKKWIIRFLIVELIANIAFFSITPYLFGSIKRFKPAKLARRAGVLDKKAIDFYMQGSYVLKSNGKKILVETKKKLDGYVGKNVVIKGVVTKSVEGLAQKIDAPAAGKNKIEVISVKSISVK